MPVWEAIADLWLDTVIDETITEGSARVLAASPFSMDELRRIRLYEVAPAVHANLKVVAGEWAGFDRDWLRERITSGVARRGRLFRWWVDYGWGRWWMGAFAETEWRTVIRASPRSAAAPRLLPDRDPPLLLLRIFAVTVSAPVSTAAVDAGSIEGIITTLYALISGAPGQPRDWDRFRALFIEGARLIPTNRAIHDGQGGHPPEVMDVETFIRTTGPVVQPMGFDERQIAMRVERFGCVAHAWSTYESRRAPGDAEPFARGINSIQLYHDGARWWVVTVFWDSERAGNPIPAAYLPG